MLSAVLFATAAACTAPSVDEVAARIAARAQADIVGPVRLRFRKLRIEENTSDPDDPRVSGTKEWDAVGVGTQFVQTLRTENGRSVSARPEPKVFDPQREFIRRYRLALAEPCPIAIDGRPHWAIAFRPRTDVPLPEGQEEDDLFNRLSGLLYVDADGWFIRSVTGTLTEPYRAGLMGIGRIHAADLWIEQSEVNGIVVLQHVVIDVRFTKFGFARGKRITHRYDGYTPVLPPAPPP